MFRKASQVFKAEFKRNEYDERTCRNHFWIGGPEGQETIRKLSIGVAGMGGMGANIANHLVRLGVGHLRIADPDTIEATNLNRQVIARKDSLGSLKVDAAIRDLRNIAEDFELVAYNQGITEEMAEEFVEGCDAIVDEVDVYQLETHVALHKAARARGLPLYSSYAVGFGIHFYKFHGKDYTFEDFLGGNPAEWKKPTAEFLLDRIGKPYPSYIDEARERGFASEIRGGGTPIFGPTTLLGQSLVTIRMILDLLAEKGVPRAALGGANRTPVMPEFLVLDSADLSIKLARVPE
jgi:molybdopterin/thiamine biosynthesis adenylyltransferase